MLMQWVTPENSAVSQQITGIVDPTLERESSMYPIFTYSSHSKCDVYGSCYVRGLVTLNLFNDLNRDFTKIIKFIGIK